MKEIEKMKNKSLLDLLTSIYTKNSDIYLVIYVNNDILCLGQFNKVYDVLSSIAMAMLNIKSCYRTNNDVTIFCEVIKND